MVSRISGPVVLRGAALETHTHTQTTTYTHTHTLSLSLTHTHTFSLSLSLYIYHLNPNPQTGVARRGDVQRDVRAAWAALLLVKPNS